MSRNFAIILSLIVILFGGLFFFAKNDANAPSDSSSNAQPTNHVKGNTSSKVTLIEYADFQCPACAQYYPIVDEVVETYKDQIQFQYVHFPLYQIHQNAMASHKAAEAAAAQGKFWEMYDALYQNQQLWSTSTTPTVLFEQYATNLGLDIEQFKQDTVSSETNDIIWADINKANDAKVNSTPTFFLNGKKIDTPPSLDDFKNVIEDAIAASTSNE